MKNTLALLTLAAAAPALAQPVVSNYDDLTEGFLGQTFSCNGVTYSEVNDIGGSFPGGDTFTPEDIGNNFIIENSTFLFNDFPDWGSPANTLTFGTAYIPGNNLSLGAFARATMTFDQPVSSVSVDMVFYENGPWGGIVFHLDGIRDGLIVASAVYTLADGGGRDNIAFTNLSIADAGGIDFIKMYATNGADFSAPRLMIDDLTVVPMGGSDCPADFNGDDFVDFFDYTDFVAAFESGDLSADFNGDSFVDFFDYGDYVLAFETGC